MLAVSSRIMQAMVLVCFSAHNKFSAQIKTFVRRCTTLRSSGLWPGVVAHRAAGCNSLWRSPHHQFLWRYEVLVLPPFDGSGAPWKWTVVFQVAVKLVITFLAVIITCPSACVSRPNILPKSSGKGPPYNRTSWAKVMCGKCLFCWFGGLFSLWRCPK